MSQQTKSLLCYMDFATHTGFSSVAHNVLDRLLPYFQENNVLVSICATNYLGQPFWYEGKNGGKAYVRSAKDYAKNMNDLWYRDGMLKLLNEKNWDIFWAINDIPVFSPMMGVLNDIRSKFKYQKKQTRFKAILYTPVDSPCNPMFMNDLNFWDSLVTYTEYGKKQIERFEDNPISPRTIDVIPHGANRSDFYPIKDFDIQEGRKKWKLPKNGFIFGNVNKNNSRKNIGGTLLAFRNFLDWYQKNEKLNHTLPQPYLYLHCSPTDETGINCYRACESLGISKYVFYPEKEEYKKGAGYTTEEMNEVYNCLNCYVTTTGAEGWGLCLHSDTLIETKNGIKHIKDIKAETKHQDYVLGNDGIFHKVLDTIYRDLDEYYELHSSYNIPVKVSAEHPFYVTDGINQPYWSNVVDLIGKSNMYVAMRKPVIDDNPHLNEHISNLIDMSNPNYIVDGDLIYDKCGYSPTAKLWSISSVMKKYSVTKNSAEKAISLLTKDITLKNEGIIDLARQMKFDGFVKNQPIKINNEFEITEELAEVFGWYLAEGSNEKGNRIEFSLNGTLIGSKAKFIQDTLYKTFNVTSFVEMSGINKCRVRVSSGILSELFGNLFGIHAENKKVPNFLYQHQRFAKSLIKGYLLGDGHISEKRSHVSYCSKSKSLAFQIRSMMLKFGIMSSLSYSEKRNIYNVVVTRDSLPNIKSILGNELVFRNENTRKHRPNYIETDTHYFVPITSIAKIKLPITQKFYDLCVDETHSFVANGIVCHNTTTEAMAVGLPIVAPLHTSIKEICENGAACYPVSILSEQILTHDYENVRFIPDPVNTAFAMTQAYNDVIEGKFPHKNAYTDILAEYDWDKIAEQWKQIFSKYL